ncbi:MAG: lipocalin-like domain-containing protein [Novosphingobium sp.]|nr:lipocalin-like domain-containing protein [Novosphingobium sp.]
MHSDDLIGSWRLEGVELVEDDVSAGPPPFGGNPEGILHYLPDRRMAVIIQQPDRPPIEGGRRGGSDAEWRSAARSFTAYAGSWTLEPGRVIHHVEFNNFPNDVGVDYVRIARIEGDVLHLETPPDLPADQRPMRLVWRRFAA